MAATIICCMIPKSAGGNSLGGATMQTLGQRISGSRGSWDHRPTSGGQGASGTTCRA
ncbi:UNVERIFIED_CONTAM: hypothetical protein Slati_2937100 [Sesamum latifolium]|uniref:Uncharacterized protein n=1 Tax=Sesamum latifolium TaxID=2727402 RepID=A0AAW2VEQ2_9LAMI